MSKFVSSLFLIAVLVLGMVSHAQAKDGGSGGGGNSGSGNSGSGGSGSGNDDGGDDNGGDDDNDDDDDDDNSSGSGKLKDQDKIKDAVASGKAASLSKLIKHLSAHYPGKVLRVDLQRRSGIYYYKIKILTANGRIRSVRLNARTLELET